MPYEQDEIGQWWEVGKTHRVKASLVPCQRCGKPIVRSSRYIKNQLEVRCDDCWHAGKYIGKTFGNYTVLKRINKGYYLCRCACGKELQRLSYNLKKTIYHQGCPLKPEKDNYRGLSLTTFNEIKGRAHKRGIGFHVSQKELADLFHQQDEKCALSGRPISIQDVRVRKKYKGRNGKRDKWSSNTFINASLDRIDSDKDYTIDNLQWVEKDINWMKRILSQERFIELCTNVTNHNKEDRNDRSNANR